MKKSGFTLAEVLITLGIIGVISALTLPSLLNDTQGAQVGPRLGKAASMFEQANQKLLEENNVDSLSDGGFLDSIVNYREGLEEHLKISRFRGSYPAQIPRDSTIGPVVMGNNDSTWLSKDGTVYWVSMTRGANTVGSPHRVRVGTVLVDINGPATPNLPGTDIFAFLLHNDGSLVPVGSSALEADSAGDSPLEWRDECPNDRVPNSSRYYTCTASIFDNNMKVMYKMR